MKRLIGVLCECSDRTCKERLSLSVEESRFVRSVPNRVVVKPGHTHIRAERVLVEEPGRFQVIATAGPGDSVLAHARRR